MSRKQIIITVLMLLGLFSFFATAEAASDGGSSGSGIEGVISISPAMPGPARAGVPESQPLANMTWVVHNEKGIVSSFTTNAEGRFHISLPPGHYTVSREQRVGQIGHFGPFDVDVAPGKMTSVDWKCDSGIR
jgi:hypothetical protein